VTVQIMPIAGIPEVQAGDDLARLVLDAIRANGETLAEGDVGVVTQKVVSKAEGRVVPEGVEGKAGWARREARRVVARRGDLLIAETRHGFVCANAGVDASNVAAGFLALLPEDPDGSADRLREAFQAAAGARVAVLVTDTFGRAWRTGLVNVAIGCSGLPAAIDLRGTRDALGRELEVTVEALADEVAAASGLVMGKADGVPVAIVRGVRAQGDPSPAAALLRPPAEDLFRTSPLEAVRGSGRRTGFGPQPVPREALLEAVAAAVAGADGGGERPWLFVAMRSAAARRRLRHAAGEGREVDPWEVGAAAALLVPCADAGSAAAAGEDLPGPELLRAGAAVQRLVLALEAQGLVAGWNGVSPSAIPAIRSAAGVDDRWVPLGIVAVGVPRAERPAVDVDVDPSPFLIERE
jgi:coenzyme F420-0:L-glutamate ligase/coenzyme F420-1:gamma-L-glutamate ligase